MILEETVGTSAAGMVRTAFAEVKGLAFAEVKKLAFAAVRGSEPDCFLHTKFHHNCQHTHFRSDCSNHSGPACNCCTHHRSNTGPSSQRARVRVLQCGKKA